MAAKQMPWSIRMMSGMVDIISIFVYLGWIG